MKTTEGHFFEDFIKGQIFHHGVPRTLTTGDQAVYLSLFGSRFPLSCASSYAESLGYTKRPLDELLVFHTVFGKSVPDISFNAVANLGYADVRFLEPVYPEDTLSALSEVIGLKQNSTGDSGIVYVKTTGFNQNKAPILSFNRWVMVKKKNTQKSAPEAFVPSLPSVVNIQDCSLPQFLKASSYKIAYTQSNALWNDYEIGEKILHRDGYTIEESEHQMATRLYQNTARVHFNHHTEAHSRFGRRLIYGGHIISLVRSLTFNGLANGFQIIAMNAGRHVAPTFAGDTVYAWSEVIDKKETCEPSLGALRIRSIGIKNTGGDIKMRSF
jgi:2-methylfumaryl-CoA hydratase